MNSAKSYFGGLSGYVSGGWNRFWFEPSDVFDLCVLRVLVGAMALIWQVSFTADLTTWFAADGWLNDAVASGLLADTTGYNYSYLRFDNHPTVLWIAQWLGSCVLFAFMIGLWTRFTAIGALVVMLSYAHRALILAGPAEPVLTMLVFYLCFAPVGAYLSVDARSGKRATLQLTWTWWATLARRLIQVHLIIVYLAMALTALGSETWWNGDAIWWISAQPDSRLVDFTFLREYPILINLWTHTVLIGTFFFVVCVWNEWLRPLAIVVSILIWISLALVTGNLAHSAVMIVANLSFVPSDFWRSVLGRSESQVIGSELAN
ncbi:MAG: hypothetical protein P8N76_20480 [Pirellulaceae bacterium]|nr:hypothetical protein [Pirellulaceae bacterium]